MAQCFIVRMHFLHAILLLRMIMGMNRCFSLMILTHQKIDVVLMRVNTHR